MFTSAEPLDLTGLSPVIAISQIVALANVTAEGALAEIAGVLGARNPGTGDGESGVIGLDRAEQASGLSPLNR